MAINTDALMEVIGDLESNYSAVLMERKDLTNIFGHTRHGATQNSLSDGWDTYRTLNQTHVNIGDFSSFSSAGLLTIPPAVLTYRYTIDQKYQ